LGASTSFFLLVFFSGFSTFSSFSAFLGGGGEGAAGYEYHDESLSENRGKFELITGETGIT
jgi:hypothetical protein